MSLIPISKKSMQELQHFTRVKERIIQIYTNAINAAKNGCIFYSEIIVGSHNLYSPFTKDIAKGVQECFPDSDITIHADMDINPKMIQSTIDGTSIVIYEVPESSGIAYRIYIDWS